MIYARLRSTYMHEIDSARGFSDFNDPARMRDARAFQRAASKIGYTFNWLYADDRDIAYFNSGDNPQRAKGTTGQLPMPAKHAWRGFDPDRLTAAYTSFAKHPQTINGQPYLTSWNNKQARGYAGADSNLFSSVYRSQMLDAEIDARIAGARKITLPGLVEAMGEAATTDLRAEQVLGAGAVGHRHAGRAAPRRRRRQAARVDRRGLAPPRPRRRRGLRARRRDPHPRRLLAAVDARAVRAVARRRALRPARRRARARQRAQQPRRARRLGLPDRLVRLRRQGPAPDPRAQARRAVLQALLRRRQPRPLPHAAALARCRARSTTSPATLYADEHVRAGRQAQRPGVLRRDRVPRDRRASRSR